MTMMVAKYERNAKLNVRKEPKPDAKVVRVMSPGETGVVEVVKDGWCKFADGYAKADFLTVALECEAVDGEKPDDASDAADMLQEADAPEAEAPADDDKGSELWGMSNTELYALAEQSDIKLKKGLKKADLVAAILDHD